MIGPMRMTCQMFNVHLVRLKYVSPSAALICSLVLAGTLHNVTGGRPSWDAASRCQRQKRFCPSRKRPTCARLPPTVEACSGQRAVLPLFLETLV